MRTVGIYVKRKLAGSQWHSSIEWKLELKKGGTRIKEVNEIVGKIVLKINIGGIKDHKGR